jgi:alpha-mannosidase
MEGDTAESPAQSSAETSVTVGVPTLKQWNGVSLIPWDSREPSPTQSDAEAEATWAVVSALWHPAILARAQDLPRNEDIDSPSSARPDEICLVTAGLSDRLPSGYRTSAADIGAVVIDAEGHRLSMVRAILQRVDAEIAASLDDADPLVLDFFALGTVRWFLRDLTIGMGHVDCLDTASLTREVLAGAQAWVAGDFSAAASRLRASFELLTQARERFYPVDSYVVDLCLLDPSLPSGALAEPLSSRAPISFIASALAIEAAAERDPERIESIRRGIDDGWIDVVGGANSEVDEPLLPIESILWQFRKGAEVYRKHLDDRNTETLAQRRFALYPQRPQIGRRFGFRFAVHLAFDAGRFPVRPETKRLWESPDGTSLEALTRPPMGADRPSQGSIVPWRIARSMKDDHIATLAMVHWPKPVSGWYLDWRRSATYSPVLSRWVTLGDYFGFTDRPFESFRPALDEYVTPYLAQAVARDLESPIAHRAEHVRARARLDALLGLRALSSLLAPTPPSDEVGSPVTAIEDALESGRTDDARSLIEVQEPAVARELSQIVSGTGTGERPGYLVFNPIGIARRAAVLLPEADADLRAEGPLRVSQFTDEGVWAIVDLPAFGYAWIPRSSLPGYPPVPPSSLGVKGRTLKNESVEIEVDDSTGGIRSIRAVGEETARAGQQLVIAGLIGPDGQPAGSKMRSQGFEVDYGGPALVQAESRGQILDSGDRALATFRQRFRLWSGRPIAEIDVTVDNVDSSWAASLAKSDPWHNYLACRWAWPDPNSSLRRMSLLSPELTEVERPETPDAIDISTRRQRTALLFGGLAHHKRHGSRMLDTLLIAGRETCRRFRLGVVLDREHPFQPVLDLTSPAIVVGTDQGPPRAGLTGWFFQMDHKAVAVTRVQALPSSGDGRGWGVAFHLLETAGNPARCRLRLFRAPIWARQTDFHGELIVDLSVEDDAVAIDLTPYEMARIDVTLG